MALELPTAEEGVEGDDTKGELRIELRSLQGQLADFTLNCSPSTRAAGRLASHLRVWSELVLVQLFKNSLHPNILQWALIHGDPETLMEWIRWAGDTKLRIQQVEQSEQRPTSAALDAREGCG
uniref:Uncharacterized protein n=1 Tax=Sphaerodactylus townsendi TaxID=933632 RepID=A0ACB8FSW0_9SAUR